jgi:hypothetical protein
MTSSIAFAAIAPSTIGAGRNVRPHHPGITRAGDAGGR